MILSTSRVLLILVVVFAGSVGFCPGQENKSPAAAGSVDDITLVLAQMAIETKAEAIPAEAYQAAKAAMLDALGCAIAGHNMPGVPAIIDLTEQWGGRADATIWFTGTKVPAPAAAFVNSVQLHALDFDDYHGPSDAHMTAVLVPTVLALGELYDASGQETLAALVLGAEVIGRLGRAHNARKAHSGFLPTSVIGGFGATAAACRLQGCSVQQMVDALGIWCAHVSGNRQALFDRTLTKRIQPGIAARDAVFAACLAHRDFTGPRRIVGGQIASLTQIYGCRPDAEPPSVDEIMREYESWQIEQLQFKCYACCGYSGKAIAAAIALATEHKIAPQDIQEIRVFGDDNASPFACVPWEDNAEPHVLAQFCLPHATASAIKNRRYGPDEIAPARIAADREVDALARRTRMCSWDQWQGPRPASRFAMQVLLNDGRRLETTQNRHRRYRWSEHKDQLIAKFENNVAFSGWMEKSRVDALIEAIDKFDDRGSTADFVKQWLARTSSDSASGHERFPREQRCVCARIGNSCKAWRVGRGNCGLCTWIPGSIH